MLTVLCILPVASAATALLFRDKPWIRWLSVMVILMAFCGILGLLIAPHRLAESLFGHPGPEWLGGARATRDVVHRAIPVIVSALLSLTVLALLPYRMNSNKE